MKEFITEKGNVLYYSLSYDLGGYSYATNKDMKRGYYLSVQRQKHLFTAHEGLNHESGAVRVFIHEVKRKSQKQENMAYEKAIEKIKEIAESYDL